jgi:hypothetical protein
MIGLIPLLRPPVEGDAAVQGAMVGDGHRIHAQLCGRVDQLRDPAEAVEQAELGVDVEVREVVRGDGHVPSMVARPGATMRSMLDAAYIPTAVPHLFDDEGHLSLAVTRFDDILDALVQSGR